MAGALIVGIGSAFGEVSHFGYLKKYPSKYVGPFCSGTGICGLAGSFMYLLLHSMGVRDYVIFFALIPIALIYLVNFLFLFRISEKHEYFHNQVEEVSYVYGENLPRVSDIELTSDGKIVHVERRPIDLNRVTNNGERPAHK